jgi:hypothetical protein
LAEVEWSPPLAGWSCAAFPDTFWSEGLPYVEDGNITSAAGCCNFCIANPRCLRYQFTDFGAYSVCYLFDTATADEPAPSLASTAGNGERSASLIPNTRSRRK